MGIQDQDWDGWSPLCHLEMQKICQRSFVSFDDKISWFEMQFRWHRWALPRFMCTFAHLVHLAPSSHFKWSVCHHFHLSYVDTACVWKFHLQPASVLRPGLKWLTSHRAVSSCIGGFTFDGQGRWASRRTEAKPDAFLTTMEEIGVQHQNASCLGVKRCLIIFSRRRRLCQTAPQPHLTWRLIYGDTSLTFG